MLQSDISRRSLCTPLEVCRYVWRVLRARNDGELTGLMMFRDDVNEDRERVEPLPQLGRLSEASGQR